MKHSVRLIMASVAALSAASIVNGRQPTLSQQQQGVVEDLEAQVTAVEGAAASATVLITEFAKYVEAHKGDPVALQAFVDRLRASADPLAAAVAANPDPDATD
jgi:hypothetical protein